MKHPFLLAAAALMVATSACAHVVLDEPAVLAGRSYRAAFRVGHGCGEAATTALRVSIPDGFRGAKPMPKPGWTLAIRRAPLAQPYQSHGKTVSEDVVEITWSAATPEAALPDAWYDEFVLRGEAPAQAGALWFKVLQSCGTLQQNWAEIPASGSATRGLKSPAALLDVIPSGSAEHAH